MHFKDTHFTHKTALRPQKWGMEMNRQPPGHIYFIPQDWIQSNLLLTYLTKSELAYVSKECMFYISLCPIQIILLTTFEVIQASLTK